MKNKILKYGRKEIAVGIIFLFVGMNISFFTVAAVVENKISEPLILNNSILYVGGYGPGNYSTIQSAVDDAVDGDTVFVYSGIYDESVTVRDKTVNLIGEDKKTTIINGQTRSVVLYTLDGEKDGSVTISGFTIQNSSTTGSAHSGISINAISPWIYNDFFTISDNIIKDNRNGIYLQDANNVTITGNVISNNICGINIRYWARSNFSVKEKGAYNTISNNDIIDNEIGIFLERTSKNTIYENNFIGNSQHASFKYMPLVQLSVFIYMLKPDRNYWQSNYWENCHGSTLGFPKIILGKTLLSIPMINFDWHPAKEPYDIV